MHNHKCISKCPLNRLTDAGGQAYTWDNNGNLPDDGTSTYTYDAANRLTSLTQGTDTYNFAYNGLGDRLQQMAKPLLQLTS